LRSRRRRYQLTSLSFRSLNWRRQCEVTKLNKANAPSLRSRWGRPAASLVRECRSRQAAHYDALRVEIGKGERFGTESAIIHSTRDQPDEKTPYFEREKASEAVLNKEFGLLKAFEGLLKPLEYRIGAPACHWRRSPPARTRTPAR
jgi:hypothetical protein